MVIRDRNDDDKIVACVRSGGKYQWDMINGKYIVVQCLLETLLIRNFDDLFDFYKKQSCVRNNRFIFNILHLYFRINTLSLVGYDVC